MKKEIRGIENKMNKTVLTKKRKENSPVIPENKSKETVPAGMIARR